MIAEDNLFIYRATVLRVIDGDTVDLDVDLGFYIHNVKLRVRLLGIDTPELKLEERASGELAKAELIRLLSLGTLLVKTHIAPPGSDSFGRWLADIQVTQPDGTSFNVVETMLNGGFGIPWVKK